MTAPMTMTSSMGGSRFGLTIKIAGVESGPEFWDAVAEIRVRMALSQPTAIEIRSVLPPLADLTPVKAGDELRLTGSRNGPNELDVMAHVTRVDHHFDASGVQLQRIVALDRLDHLRRMQTVRSLTEVTAEELTEEVLRAVDLSVDHSPNMPAVRVAQCHQFLANDYDFLIQRLAAHGRWLLVSGAQVRLTSLTHPLDEKKLTLGSEVSELTVTTSTEALASSTSCAVWDPERAEPTDASADQPRLATTPAPAEQGWVRRIHHGGALDQASARSVAQATLDRATATGSAVAGTGVSLEDLHPGTQCTFVDPDGVVLASQMITTVDHQISGLGFVTAFSSESPTAGSGPESATSSILRGRVEKVDDPDRRGRVRVILPTVGDIITPWLDVLMPGVNATRGLIATPEVGDVVAVAVVDGDLAQGLVLGSTADRGGPPGKTVNGQQVRGQAWHSSANQFVRLDHPAGSVTAQNRAGSRLRLGAKTTELHSETDLLIAAPGQTITIRAAAVAFEQE